MNEMNMQLPKILQLKPAKDQSNNAVVVHPDNPPPIPQVFDEQPSHTHQWLQEAVSYGPPRRDIQNLSVVPELLQKLALGVTTIVDKCQICSDTKTVEFLGSPHPQLDDMLDKADLYGPQYLQKNGVTYLIQKFVPQHQGPLPIR